MSNRTAQPVAGNPGPAGAPPAARQTILLADDDIAVRRVATTILERHGYTVLGVENSSAALEMFEAARGRIALVILDLKMPGPGVETTLAALRAIDAGVRVLLMSGCMEPDLTPETTSHLRGFLGKPFRGGELLRAVEMALVSS
jgi:two-component system cell cycle sensor histidine kinase/response regulator CckA